ncbi:MAG: hypothetical protein GOU98_02650 [Candidatus Altiarchaeota archaeon]|nr:hypothetical protein [Candidatus Altiarchaeota archaeon]
MGSNGSVGELFNDWDKKGMTKKDVVVQRYKDMFEGHPLDEIHVDISPFEGIDRIDKFPIGAKTYDYDRDAAHLKYQTMSPSISSKMRVISEELNIDFSETDNYRDVRRVLNELGEKHTNPSILIWGPRIVQSYLKRKLFLKKPTTFFVRKDDNGFSQLSIDGDDVRRFQESVTVDEKTTLSTHVTQLSVNDVVVNVIYFPIIPYGQLAQDVVSAFKPQVVIPVSSAGYFGDLNQNSALPIKTLLHYQDGNLIDVGTISNNGIIDITVDSPIEEDERFRDTVTEYFDSLVSHGNLSTKYREVTGNLTDEPIRVTVGCENAHAQYGLSDNSDARLFPLSYATDNIATLEPYDGVTANRGGKKNVCDDSLAIVRALAYELALEGKMF